MRTFVILSVFALCVAASWAFQPETGCDEDTQSVVLQHYGDDYQAGDRLNDQINELLADSSNGCRREIILKCKHAGCKYFLSATVDIDLTAITGGLKIRGLLKDGRRPVIWNSGPINITVGGVAASIIHFEKVNLQADGFTSSLSNVNIDVRGRNQRVVFDECDFIGHSAGYGNGGALNIQQTATGGSGDLTKILVTSCKFINNSAKNGGAIWIGTLSQAQVKVLDTVFVDNAAIEEGGAVWTSSPALFEGCHFKTNTANKKGDNFVGRGGAIFCEGAGHYGEKLVIRESRTHGGNSAQFGNFMFAAECNILVDGFGCYEGPYLSNHETEDRHAAYGYDSYVAYPVCSADSYDTYAPREDIYLEDSCEVIITRTDLPAGIICSEDAGKISTVTREGCGSRVETYHCDFDGTVIDAEDYDRDGFDCRYDCNDLWNTVYPGAGEQCNQTEKTEHPDLIHLHNPRGYGLNWRDGDSNCNGLSDEFIDTDGDWVPNPYDLCPLDYWKIDPGMCGCGIEETYDCGAAASDQCGTTEYGGVWYYMCDGNWWYWGESDWVYGGVY